VAHLQEQRKLWQCFPFLPVADGVFSDMQESRKRGSLPATEAIEADRDRLRDVLSDGWREPSWVMF